MTNQGINFHPPPGGQFSAAVDSTRRAIAHLTGVVIGTSRLPFAPNGLAPRRHCGRLAVAHGTPINIDSNADASRFCSWIRAR
jgi:hypothetical protein